MFVGNSEGKEGSIFIQKFEGQNEARLEIPGGGRVKTKKKNILGGDMDILWNHTIQYMLFTPATQRVMTLIVLLKCVCENNS